MKSKLSNRSRLVVLALVALAMSLVAASCSDAQTAQDDTKTDASGSEVTLGLSVSTLSNPFFVALVDGAKVQAQTSGVELVVVDAQDDPATEASNIEDLITQKVDAILINPTDSDAIVPSIERANDAGIPVFTIDRSASGGEVVAHVASDNIAGGALAGAFLCEAIEAKGNVVELQGIAGTSAANDRGQGFNDYLASECSDVKVVAAQTANFDRAEGLTVFENILSAHSDIAAVFAHNDEMILGAIEAARAAGRNEEIVFVGFDAVDDATAAVKAGDLAATVAQQPDVIGKLGVESAVKLLNDEAVDSYIPVDLSVVSE